MHAIHIACGILPVIATAEKHATMNNAKPALIVRLVRLIPHDEPVIQRSTDGRANHQRSNEHTGVGGGHSKSSLKQQGNVQQKRERGESAQQRCGEQRHQFPVGQNSERNDRMVGSADIHRLLRGRRQKSASPGAAAPNTAKTTGWRPNARYRE
jgi:hypothetical protein